MDEGAASELSLEFIRRLYSRDGRGRQRPRRRSVTETIGETHQAECYLPLSEQCRQLICDI